MTYYKEAFRVLLDQFALKVKQGKYKKLDYNLWRDLYGLAKLPDGVDVQVDKSYMGGIDLDILPIHGDKIRHYDFETEDGSFGEFLANELSNSNLQVKACVFGEPTANKTVIGYNSVDLDSITLSYDDNFKVHTLASDTYIPYGNAELNTIATMSDLAITRERVKELGKMVQDYVNKDKIFNERKENEKMKGFNFDFGSCECDNVRMSMYGLAVRNASGTWVAYDKTANILMDVDIFNFEGGKYMYKIPVPVKDIAKGDIIIHCRKPMFVTGVADGKICAVDPCAGEEKVVLLAKSPFGFDFATKIVSLFDSMPGVADASNPFGNMLPFLMLNEGSDIDPMMLMAMGGKMDMSNPMMMYLLMKDGGNSDMLPFLLMGGMNCACKEG